MLHIIRAFLGEICKMGKNQNFVLGAVINLLYSVRQGIIVIGQLHDVVTGNRFCEKVHVTRCKKVYIDSYLKALFQCGIVVWSSWGMVGECGHSGF